MTVATSLPGHDTALSALKRKSPTSITFELPPEADAEAKTHRVTFAVTSDFLAEAQEVLFNAQQTMQETANYIELLEHCMEARDMGQHDPRAVSAFKIGAAAFRAMAEKEGAVLSELFGLMDDAKNISKAV